MENLQSLNITLEDFEPPYDLIINNIKLLKKVSIDNRNDGYLAETKNSIKIRKFVIKNMIFLPYHLGVKIENIVKLNKHKMPIFVAVFFLKKPYDGYVSHFKHEDLYYFAIAKASIQK